MCRENGFFNAIMRIKSGAVGANGFSIKFIHILSVLTHFLKLFLIFLRFGRLLFFGPLSMSGAPTGEFLSP
jgi:hypothetical protein